MDFSLNDHQKLIIGFFLASVLSAANATAVSDDYAHKSVTELIDALTEIDSQAPGINSAGIYEGFIADNTPGSFQGGVLGVAPPKVPPQMSELVRRGPLALPELIKHLDDRRPTKLEVGNSASTESSQRVGVNFFWFMYFSNEYDPRLPHWFNKAESKRRPSPMQKDFEGRYTVKVGDVCYVLFGQIVNRHLLAVRYQPSAGLVVNSPIEAPVLIEKVRNDWGSADAETLKASLLDDIHNANYPKYVSKAENTGRFVNPALQRLRLYFPDIYNALAGDDLRKRREFERQEIKRQPQSKSHTTSANKSGPDSGLTRGHSEAILWVREVVGDDPAHRSQTDFLRSARCLLLPGCRVLASCVPPRTMD